MIRVGKPLAPNTFVIYVGTEIVDVVYAKSRAHAYVMENVQARDITWD